MTIHMYMYIYSKYYYSCYLCLSDFLGSKLFTVVPAGSTIAGAVNVSLFIRTITHFRRFYSRNAQNKCPENNTK